MESPSEFFDICWHPFQKFSLFQATGCIVIGAMSKRGQDITSSDGSPVAKARRTNLVMHGQCKKDVSPQRWRSLVNSENDNNRKWVSLVTENWCSSDSNFEVGSSQVYRQKKGQSSPQGNSGRKTKPERKVKRILLAQRNLMHHHQKWRT